MRTPAKPSSGLVRTFSDELREINSTDPLSRGLAAKVAHDRHREEFLIQEWNILLSEARNVPKALVQEEHVVLLDQSRRLYAAWTKFRKSLPEHQQAQVDSTHRPDIKFLMETVKRAASTWQEDREQSRTGRLKEKFFRLCDNCHNHSALLSVIPSHDKYLSLFTGSLSAIAQASINHQNIAEGVVDGLDELSKDIEFWNRQIEEHGDIKMLRQHIQELYVIVFEVFTDIFTSWSKSSWKRFLTSFDESAFTKLFTEKRGRIEAIERRIQQEITLEFQRKTSRSLQKLVSDQEKLLALLPQQLDQQRYLLGSSIQKFLEEQWQSAQLVSGPSSTFALESAGQPPQSLTAEPDVVPEDDDSSPMVMYNYDRADLTSAIPAYLDQFKDEMRELVKLSFRAPYLQVEWQVHQKLILWLQDLNSTNLWIQGPHGVAKPSQASMIAVSVVSLSHKSGIPTVSYFCSLGYDIHSPQSRHDALRTMLMSLIAQLVLFLPERGSTPTELSLVRFASIAQTVPTIEELLQLIRDLRRAGSRYMHCVIDSIQILEDRSDQVFTKELLLTIATLCDLAYDVSHQTHGGKDDRCLEEATMFTKTLFTTDRVIDGLSQAAEIDLVEKIESSAEASDRIEGETTYMGV